MILLHDTTGLWLELGYVCKKMTMRRATANTFHFICFFQWSSFLWVCVYERIPQFSHEGKCRMWPYRYHARWLGCAHIYYSSLLFVCYEKVEFSFIYFFCSYFAFIHLVSNSFFMSSMRLDPFRTWVVRIFYRISRPSMHSAIARKVRSEIDGNGVNDADEKNSARSNDSRWLTCSPRIVIWFVQLTYRWHCHIYSLAYSSLRFLFVFGTIFPSLVLDGNNL